jgi:hypothetical protein
LLLILFFVFLLRRSSVTLSISCSPAQIQRCRLKMPASNIKMNESTEILGKQSSHFHFYNPLLLLILFFNYLQREHLRHLRHCGCLGPQPGSHSDTSNDP